MKGNRETYKECFVFVYVAVGYLMSNDSFSHKRRGCRDLYIPFPFLCSNKYLWLRDEMSIL